MANGNDHPASEGRRASSRPSLPPRALGDGFGDGLEPVVPLDPRAIASVDDLVRAMGRTSFGARQVGEAADLLHDMVLDRDCFVVATLSGAMTVAKMGGLLIEMIDRGMIDAVVSTGALMTHGLVEGGGMTHFKWREDLDDERLFAAGYNRVHDTLELERNLDDVGALLAEVLEDHDPRESLSSWTLCRLLGRGLIRKGRRRGILQSAYRRRVPVFIPAFSDCELGLDFGLLNRHRRLAEQDPIRFDPFEDLDAYAEAVRGQRRLGIFTIGGGVPRNWAQQVGPYLDLIERSIPRGGRRFAPFSYGIRICPDPAQWGHLSGCTYSEGISWGKFLPRKRGGRWVEVLADATIAWPIILQAVLQRLDSRGLVRVPRPHGRSRGRTGRRTRTSGSFARWREPRRQRRVTAPGSETSDALPRSSNGPTGTRLARRAPPGRGTYRTHVRAQYTTR